MNRKVYMIMPDTTAPFNLGKFHAYIEYMYKKGYIETWWHYLPGGLYFVGTTLEINQIYNLLVRHMPNRFHIIMEVNSGNKQGWLSKAAWDWFSSYKN